MNLHSIAAAATSSVNPWMTAQYQRSSGNNVDGNYKPGPTYDTAIAVQVKKQALTFKDTMQLDGINLGGEACAIYISGDIKGVLRAGNRGGDLLTLPDGTVWLAVHVLENWFDQSGWAKVAAVMQASAAT